jgi:hypothetical protein
MVGGRAVADNGEYAMHLWVHIVLSGGFLQRAALAAATSLILASPLAHAEVYAGKEQQPDIGIKWTPFDKPYDLGMQYLYNQGRTAIATAAGSALATPGALPNVNAQLNALQLFSKWQYSKNLQIRANHWFQRLSTDNWAYDNANAVSSNGVLLAGQPSAGYRANVVSLSLSYLSYSGW